MLNKVKVNVTPRVVYAIGFLPLAYLLLIALFGSLGVDPVKKLEHELGGLAIKFLIATLLISPIRALFSINLTKYRRALGLLTFLYALCHFVVWILFDVQLLWGELIKDVIKRPFISFGFLSLVGLLPLAITSNFISIKKLGLVNWKRLHVLIYPAGFFAGAHYVMVKKVWEDEALIYLIVILGLFAVRFVTWRKRVSSQVKKTNKVSKINL